MVFPNVKLPKLPGLAELPLPDLVAFNDRVRRRVGPWFERRGVRRLAWAGLGGFLLFAGIWIYFASGLPSASSFGMICGGPHTIGLKPRAAMACGSFTNFEAVFSTTSSILPPASTAFAIWMRQSISPAGWRAHSAN